jgi:hypothetical protein
VTIPPASLQPLVDYYVLLESEARGVAPDTLTSLDLQILAFGVRTAAQNFADESDAQEALDAANAIDNLSELSNADIGYLERLTATAA